MKNPCKTCINYSQEEIKNRIFVGCIDKEKEKGFQYDNFWYDHKCTNHEIRKECIKCELCFSPYCKSVFTILKDGKCENGIQIL